MRPSVVIRLPAFGIVLVLSLAACAGAAPPSATPLGTATSRPSDPQSSGASPSETPIPGCLPDCLPGQLTVPGDLPAGDYTTKYFFGGQLTVTLPADWTSFEDSTGEFALKPAGSDGFALLFWLDVYPIVDGVDGGTTPVAGVEPTADGVLGWTEANPNLQAERSAASLGGLAAEALDLRPSDAAENVDPDCPAELRPCVGLFGFPQWDGFFSEGGPFHLRLIAASARWGGQEHVIYAMIDAGTEEAWTAFGSEASAIIDGARLPLGVESP